LGLKVVNNRGKGSMPEVLWSSRYNSVKDHTGVNVPIYATGQGAREFTGVIDNTDIFKIIMKLTGNTSIAASEQ
jgi:alkaline phosphatase